VFITYNEVTTSEKSLLTALISHAMTGFKENLFSCQNKWLTDAGLATKGALVKKHTTVISPIS